MEAEIDIFFDIDDNNETNTLFTPDAEAPRIAAERRPLPFGARVNAAYPLARDASTRCELPIHFNDGADPLARDANSATRTPHSFQ